MMYFGAEASLRRISRRWRSTREVKTGDHLCSACDCGVIKDRCKDIIGLTMAKSQLSTVHFYVAHCLIETMVDEDSSVISLYYGEDHPLTKPRHSAKSSARSIPTMKLRYRCQPLYYYIISVEMTTKEATYGTHPYCDDSGSDLPEKVREERSTLFRSAFSSVTISTATVKT